MKKSTNMTRARLLTRREFVRKTLLTTGIITSAPAFLRGQNLNNKLNIAFIACGGRGNANLSELTIPPGREPAKSSENSGPHPDENVVVLCDINEQALDSAGQRYPKAKKFRSEERR